MTRGKMARRAANRREAAAIDAEIATYQRKVVEQAALIKSLRQQIVDKEQHYADNIRRVTAERDEGISPMLTVVQRENHKLRDERDRAVARRKDIDRMWDRVFRRTAEWLHENSDMTREEVLDLLMHLSAGKDLPEDVMVDWDRIGERKGLDSTAVRRISRARRQRHGGATISPSNELIR